VKQLIREKIRIAIGAKAESSLHVLSEVPFTVETPKGKGQGDFSTNIALLGAKTMRMSPRDLADKLLPLLADASLFEGIEIAGPGFINFTMTGSSLFSVLNDILREGATFGSSKIGKGKKIHIEFVSANPTGPLHVGHGRGAAVGSALSRIYQFCGYEVYREYYVNDAGRQMDILALSVYQRYAEKYLGNVVFSENSYIGGYVSEIADAIYNSKKLSMNELIAFKADAVENFGVEKSLDLAIEDLRSFLGFEKFSALREFSCDYILKNIKNTLKNFRVEFDGWFSEDSLTKDGSVESVLEKLEQTGEIYKKEGATWFKSSNFGDEKDRVVIREDGRYTYFATDIGYHVNKMKTGFDEIINIWGADHHGYVPRLRAALEVAGIANNSLGFLLVQFASLVDNGQKIAMSTRKGSFITLDSLVNDVGVDAARFFYLIRKADQHMDFDIGLAKEKSAKNPVYYIQYAYARICSVLNQEPDGRQRESIRINCFQNLSSEYEREQVLFLSVFPDVVLQSVQSGEPNLIAQYLKELAYLFHSNYVANKILVEDNDLREARLQLAKSTKQVLENGLMLLDIARPEKM